MSTLRVHLFGKFYILQHNQVLDGFNARKVQELFCYLLLHRNHSLPRETLASALWPETTTTQSKKNLRHVLWQIQSALGNKAEAMNERLLLVEPDWVHLNTEADVWLDVAALEQAFNLVQNIPGHQLDTAAVELLQNAVQLYQGPLLEGWYHDWCLYERERHQNMYLSLLDKLMTYCEAHHDYGTALLYGVRILCYDRARERTHRRLMRLYYLNGDRAAALRQYEQCAAALDEELGAKPSKGTVGLYEQIQADMLAVSEPTIIQHELTTDIVPIRTLDEVLGQLAQFQTTLSDLQSQVQQSIQTVEIALNKTALPASSKSID